MKRVEKGFTLIELLIVVAIIAILAAIAVPNFLEAQVRAKTSRVKADMRTLAVAIVAYQVDENTAPPGTTEFINGTSRYKIARNPTADMGIARAIAFSNMTTPVSYIAAIPFDPFYMPLIPNTALTPDQQKASAWGNRLLFYERLNSPVLLNLTAGRGASPSMVYKGCVANGNDWSLESPGPRGNRGYLNYAPYILASTYYPLLPVKDWINDRIYDPTNGTVSEGGIYYTNKGFVSRREPFHMTAAGVWIP